MSLRYYPARLAAVGLVIAWAGAFLGLEVLIEGSFTDCPANQTCPRVWGIFTGQQGAILSIFIYLVGVVCSIWWLRKSQRFGKHYCAGSGLIWIGTFGIPPMFVATATFLGRLGDEVACSFLFVVIAGCVLTGTFLQRIRTEPPSLDEVEL